MRHRAWGRQGLFGRQGGSGSGPWRCRRLVEAQAIVVVSHMAALIIAPPGFVIDSMEKLKGHRVGVLGGEANAKIVDVLSKEYGFDRAKVFKDVALPDCPAGHSIQGVSALLIVIPLTGKYLSLVRDISSRAPRHCRH